MMWKEMSFENALMMMVEAFQLPVRYEMLALVYREGGEYRIMENWEVNAIMYEINPRTLRIVLWLDRVEAGILISPFVWAGS